MFPAMTLSRLCQQVRHHSRQRSIIPMNICLGLPSHCGWQKSNCGQRSIFTHNTESFIKLKEKELDVNPGFGVLHATGTIDFHIKPTSVQVRNFWDFSKFFSPCIFPIKSLEHADMEFLWVFTFYVFPPDRAFPCPLITMCILHIYTISYFFFLNYLLLYLSFVRPWSVSFTPKNVELFVSETS